jgi:hypothetical protein
VMAEKVSGSRDIRVLLSGRIPRLASWARF